MAEQLRHVFWPHKSPALYEQKAEYNARFKASVYRALYRYRQVLGGVSKFSRYGLSGMGERRATSCKFGTPNISETTTARKLKLKTQLDVVK